MTNPYNVLLVFFNNLERVEQTFEGIKNAKPAKLFLYQDGPRPNHDDEEKIREVREYIEKNIDWDCEVFRKYQENNYGVDPSVYIAIKWAFSIVDKCIILEDDDITNLSFYEFCWELLLKYENEPRISIICGMNTLTEYGPDDVDYIFTKSGSIWGWASWRRVIDSWDPSYSWLDSKEKLEIVKKWFGNNKRYKRFIKVAKRRREEKKEYYETILGVSQMFNNQLNIVPCKNLISNIGSYGGVHTSDSQKALIKKRRKLFYKPLYTLNFPLRHPKIIKEDKKYKKLVDKELNLNFFEKIIIKIKQWIHK